MGWSLGRAALAVLVVTPIMSTASLAQYRRIEIADDRRPGGYEVRHRHHCSGCGFVVERRAGEWRYVVPQAPRVDYGQSLPIYQPPIYAHPREVVPVYPIFPRSGAYPVMGAPGRSPMMERRPYYPSGSEARVITLNDPPVRPNRRRR
ncbi:MAG: hypothetical protein LCH88_19495 [Proteobacteria bacterium]|nr:hypothetical protein [Pseudomonadota bacterium]